MKFNEAWKLLQTQTPSNLSWSFQEWSEFTKFLKPHQLEAFVFTHHKSIIPKNLHGHYSSIWKRQWLRDQLFISEIEKMKSVFPQYEQRPTLLKGFAISHLIYEQPGVRFKADVDILTSKINHDSVVNYLTKNHYSEHKEGKWQANQFKRVFFKKIQNIDIIFEIHQRLFYQHDSQKWNRVFDEETGFFRLSNEDQLIHLAGHLGYQHTFVSLNWLVDIDRWLGCCSIDWNLVLEKTKSLHQINSLLITLGLLHEKLGTNLPKEIFVQIKENTVCNFALKYLFNELLVWQPGTQRFRYLLLKHLLKDCIRDSFQYDILWLRRQLWN